MKMTIDAGIAKEMFANYDRDYYTMEALETLLDWYDEIDENIEFDPIAICCDWSEYGNTPCLRWSDFLSEYNYILEQYESDRMEWDDAVDELDKAEKVELLIDLLSDMTTVIRLRNSVLVMAF